MMSNAWCTAGSRRAATNAAESRTSSAFVIGLGTDL